MQLSVTQTITSTENNYKANVNFTGGDYSYRTFTSEPKISNIPKKANKTWKPVLWHKGKQKTKIHISTAYKDSKKYTVYEVENADKITRDIFVPWGKHLKNIFCSN